MRISFVLSSLHLSGGVRVVVEYANRMAAKGHTVALVHPQGQIDNDIQSELAGTIRSVPSSIRVPKQPGKVEKLRLAWSLARAVPQSDVVIATHTPTTVAVGIATHGLRRGRPVWLYQDYLAMFAKKPVERLLLRNAVRWHHRTLVISRYCKKELLRYVPQPDKIRIVSEGLSHADLFYPAETRSPKEVDAPATILFLGDMRPRKGLFDFLAAAQQLAEAGAPIKLCIVSKESCDIRTPVPHQYIYRPSRAELANLYRSCDLFVSASWWESFGLPPLEAMACGAPVVLTNSGGVMDFAEDGVNAIVVPPRQPKQLAQAMQRVLDDPELEERLRRNGPPTAANYRWEECADRFEEELLSLTMA